jgi:DNA-binding MarR family transcriptional regulator
METAVPPDTYAGIDSIGYLLRRCAKLMAQEAERLPYERDLTFTQCVSLALIHFEVATTAGEIARNLGHNSGATTRMIDQLEAQGLVQRRRETDDRRVVSLSLTPEGVAAVKRFQELLSAFTKRILTGFDPSEVQVLVFLLKRLMGALEAADSS